nr:hypothetical protein CFP56_30102 [Quercus suber]
MGVGRYALAIFTAALLCISHTDLKYPEHGWNPANYFGNVAKLEKRSKASRDKHAREAREYANARTAERHARQRRGRASVPDRRQRQQQRQRHRDNERKSQRHDSVAENVEWRYECRESRAHDGEWRDGRESGNRRESSIVSTYNAPTVEDGSDSRDDHFDHSAKYFRDGPIELTQRWR